MSEELEPCPFCGDSARTYNRSEERREDYHDDFWTVECSNCQASVCESGRSNAVAAWNTRPAPAVQVPEGMPTLTADERKALERFVECCEDSDAGGHDVSDKDMQRLRAIGAVTQKGRVWWVTEFGDWLLDSAAPSAPVALDTGNLADDPLYKALDALYSRGWIDLRKGRDHDPRGTQEWQDVLDLFRLYRVTAPASPSVDAEKVMALVEEYGAEMKDLGQHTAEGYALGIMQDEKEAARLHAQIRDLLTPAAGQEATSKGPLQVAQEAAAAPAAVAQPSSPSVDAEKVMGPELTGSILASLCSLAHGHITPGQCWDEVRALLTPAAGRGWQPIETAPELTHVLACNALGYVGRAIKARGKWEGVGKATHWQPLPPPPPAIANQEEGK